MKYCDDHDVIDYDETGKPITRTVLRKAFEMVQDEDDWKNPICATFEVISDAAMNRISKAIEFYTGSKAEWSNSENLWLVTAKGYYLSNGENP